MLKRNIIFILIIQSTFSLFAQTKWIDPLKLHEPVIQNQGWSNEIGKSYQRLPNRAENVVRKPVWNLSRNAAGLAIHFYTNADKIEIRYKVSGDRSMTHMPTTGVSGLDLYSVDSEGNWHIINGGYQFSDTITYSFEGLMQSKYHNCGFEYRLYLPLYNKVEWLEIGVAESAEIKFIPTLKEKPIVVYGTSIAQGGCASRPGMGWTNILSRALDYPVMNLGFSGSGPLEKELVDFIDEIDASLYIYDCLPNMGSLSSEEVVKRTVYGVTKLREKRDTPILIVDHIGYTNESYNQASKDLVIRLNSASRQAYDLLFDQGVKNIYYLLKDTIDFPEDGCVDIIHPNDLGMQAYADAYEKKIREILSMPKGEIKTTQPVTQRREPLMYEWEERHRKILFNNNEHNPRKIMIGNSITHYWGGSSEPANGSISWKQKMEPAGFHNLGFGWDRIENVLWRVYHGELSGYNAEEIVVLIGSNNLGLNNDDEIITGLQFLLKQIQIRQPAAKIKVMGLLPRRNMEERIKIINGKISKMVSQHNYIFIDVSNHLLLKNQKIDESLFGDGLHPNEKGYAKIVNDIIK